MKYTLKKGRDFYRSSVFDILEIIHLLSYIILCTIWFLSSDESPSNKSST